MVRLLSIILLLISSLSVLSQSIKRVYKIPNFIHYPEGPDISLIKIEKVKFSELSQREQDSIQGVFKIGETISYETEKTISGKKVKTPKLDGH